ncbi:MAG: tail fiber domain-containing protein, partial [Salinivirgaceae bacterium]|nr:tail fiber domain-containing protein [Salinivirgaceae bacterium]
VYFDGDEGDKAIATGFAVAGRHGAAKDGEADDYLTINTDSTRFYINGGSSAKGNFGVDGREDGAKEGNSTAGFAVSGRDGSKGTANNLFGINLDQTAEVINNENRILWYPQRNAFMAGNLKVDSAAQVGTNSFNAGFQNIASGNYSQAMGYKAVAEGETSTAIGNQAKATGNSSFAFGEQTTAAGASSVAIGVGANTADTATNAFAFGERAQAAGRGSYAIGSGAIAKGTSSYAFGSNGVDTLGNWLPAASATGDFAYAIGAGTVAEGKGSTALGVYTIAKGEYSTALGYGTIADGQYSTALGRGYASGETSLAAGLFTNAIGARSTALGYLSTANGSASTAMGNRTTASGSASTAMGNKTTASNYYSTSMGTYTIASGNASTAMGSRTTASGSASTAMGVETIARGDASTAMGAGTIASGDWSTAMGFHTIANYFNETVVGRYNTKNEGLFVVGNGSGPIWRNGETEPYDTIRSDAFVVYENGDAEFRGNLYPAVTKYDWQEYMPTYTLGTSTNMWNAVYATNGVDQTSDQRLKTNIKPLEKALDKVLTLNGVTYEWRIKEFPNKNFDSNRHVGVIAQELEAVLPEAVETGADGYKSVNYSNITPLLIEAIKEQQSIINNQQQQIDELKKMVEELLKKE